MTDFWQTHHTLLEQAIVACGERKHWSAYPEAPSGKIYGETAKDDGEKAFEAMLGAAFDIAGAPKAASQMGAEKSPWGRALNVQYPHYALDDILKASQAAGRAWAKASIETRAGVCLEILHRINKQSFLMANAVMHTTGQAFVMAFQAGGPHAQDRGLEAVAYAVAEMRRAPKKAQWEKQVGKDTTIRMEKTYRLQPRGVGVVIGCSTFPTWNTYPALFANLITGNTVVIKPHAGAILPLAITARIAREVLSEAGFDPNVVLLAVDTAEKPITQELVADKRVALVDYTGGPQFGRWLRENLSTKKLYTEEAGLNCVVIESAQSFKGMCDNLAFSLSLYSGQMCTAPQNFFIPAGGIATDEGHKSFDDVAAGLKAAIDGLLSDPIRAINVLGALQNPATLERVTKAAKLAPVLRSSSAVEGAGDARTATPLLLSATSADEGLYTTEHFGPIALLIKTKDAAEALALAGKTTKTHGAITAAVYSTSQDYLNEAEDVFAEAGVALSCNLVGGIYVNQSAAFSDFHVSGANPAGNACLTDAAFVAERFRVIQTRHLV